MDEADMSDHLDRVAQTPEASPANAPRSNEPMFPTFVHDATDRTLVFISTASNETLGACLAGLGAATYLILGRVGLVLIGVVGGIALHATWDGQTGRGEGGNTPTKPNASVRRREAAIEVAQRVLTWRESKRSTSDEESRRSEESSSPAPSSFMSFRPETADALEALTDAVIRDYVKWWYSPIIPHDVAFPAATRRTLISFILSLSANLSRKRPADTFIDFTTNSSSIVIVFLTELTSALSASPGTTTDIAIKAYLEANPQSSLTNITDHNHQSKKLVMVAEDILENYLDASVYRCAPLRVFLREVLANIVFEMTLMRCSKAEWINEWVVYLLESEEPDLINAIDAGVEDSEAKKISDLNLEVKKQRNIISQANQSAATVRPPSNHKRKVSKAEEAMEEALLEAQRLSQLIAEEDAQRLKEYDHVEDDGSDSTTHGIQTPGSSQSDINNEDSRVAQRQRPSDVRREEANDSDNGSASGQGTKAFTSFNQLALEPVSAAGSPNEQDSQHGKMPVLTLYKSNVSLFDDGTTQDKRPLRIKPIEDLLIQVEPLSSNFRGWMVVRGYSDFETLHGVLKRVSAIVGCSFTDAHASIPAWKGATNSRLRAELQRYLADAVQYEALAECEGMRKFLEKERGLTRSPDKQSTFWPTPAAFETVGKGMLDVLSKAPKGVAGSGKAVFGGVTSVLSGGAPTVAKRNTLSIAAPESPPSSVLSKTRARSPIASYEEPSQPRQGSLHRATASMSVARPGSRSSQDSRIPNPRKGQSMHLRQGASLEPLRPIPYPTSGTRRTSTTPSPQRPLTPEMRLPPPPSDITDDYTSPARAAISSPKQAPPTSQVSGDGTSFFDVPSPSQEPTSPPLSLGSITSSSAAGKRQSAKRSLDGPTRPPKVKLPPAPLTEQESQVVIELLFATLTSLYSLSSAWQIRLTLLTAAKSFLLRPGNPQLASIRSQIQKSILDGNTSDAGVATHLRRLRESVLPTEEELRNLPPEPNDEKKEQLRRKARGLLVERGMPQALTSVMGAAASGEALGKLFDCLQEPNIAKGLMFGLMLQVIRAATQ